MQRFIDKLEMADIIAIVVIVGVLVLNWKGVQTMLSASVLIIVGYYFAKKANGGRSDTSSSEPPKKDV